MSFWEGIVLDGYVSFGGSGTNFQHWPIFEKNCHFLEITLPLVKEPPFLLFHGATRSLEVPEFSRGPSCLGSQGFLTFGKQAKQLLPTKNHGSRPKFRNEQPKAPTRKPFPKSKWESLTIRKETACKQLFVSRNKKYTHQMFHLSSHFPSIFLFCGSNFCPTTLGPQPVDKGLEPGRLGPLPKPSCFVAWVSLGFSPPPSDATYVHPGYDVGTWDGRRTVGLQLKSPKTDL